MNNIDLTGEELKLAELTLFVDDNFEKGYYPTEEEHDHQYDVDAAEQTKEYNDHQREEAFFSSFSDR